jgi:hypothetical protein
MATARGPLAHKGSPSLRHGQVDGEPFSQGPCVMAVACAGTVPVLRRPSRAQEGSLSPGALAEVLNAAVARGESAYDTATHGAVTHAESPTPVAMSVEHAGCEGHAVSTFLSCG